MVKDKLKKDKKSKHEKVKKKKTKKKKSKHHKKSTNDNNISDTVLQSDTKLITDNNISISVGGWSWGNAFAAASKVQPNQDDLDDNFLKATASSSDGTKNISQLATEHNEHKIQASEHKIQPEVPINSDNTVDRKKRTKRKRSDSGILSNDNNDDGDSDDLTLEGRMVSTSTTGDMSLVLVHKESGKVYSSGERNKQGHRLVIGKIVRGNDIELDPLAVEEMKQLDEGYDTSQQELAAPSFPYPTNADDHCESPLQSYKDILPLLNALNKSIGERDKDSLQIYDPYFCDGSVIKHLSSLGYNNVYNKKEDCYAVWESNNEPQCDVFITNPPYSDDHIEKLMRHVSSPSFGSKPWLLLMPQYVHKKEYYINATTKNQTRPINPFYIVPKKRYIYKPPANFREKKDSNVHKKSSPFVSMWYIWGGSEKRNGELMNAFRNSCVMNTCDLARSKSALRDLRRSSSSGDGGKKKKKKTKK